MYRIVYQTNTVDRYNNQQHIIEHLYRSRHHQHVLTNVNINTIKINEILKYF